MEIEVYRGLIPFLIKYKEFRRAAEKFKKDEDRQHIYFTCRRDDGCLDDDSVYVRQMESNCYIFT